MDTIDSCINKIRTYLSSDSFHQPLFVNVDNITTLQQLKDEIPAGVLRRSASDFCPDKDDTPSMDAIFDGIKRYPDSLLLTDIIPALELQGDSVLKSTLSSLVGLAIQGKVIIVCYQAMKYFDFNDPRFSRRFIQIGGMKSTKPNIVFIPQSMSSIALKPCFDGINELLENYEKIEDDRVFVITRKHKSDFPNSYFFLSELSNAYDILSEIDSSLVSALEKKLGTAEQWKGLLEYYSKNHDWNGITKAEFGANSNLPSLIQSWSQWDSFHQWLFFLLLKINEEKGTGYLYRVAASAESQSDFIRTAYREILSLSVNDPSYWRVYSERKTLLNALNNPDGEAIDFCLFVDYQKDNAIFYLTDNTRQEREKIVSCIATYKYSAKALTQILNHVYPELAWYLSPYQFDNQLLNDYFQQYKILKLTNTITPDFEDAVKQQAISRDYNRLLPSRSSIIEKFCKPNTCAYWIDALGVEYLGLIMRLCHRYGLMAKVTVCRSNLPTITSINKEFMDVFSLNGMDVSVVKELDEIKHHGKDNYDYEKTKLPIHLIREIEIVKEVVRSAFHNLKKDKYKKALIVSDHGASRLAVIKEKTIDIDVDSKGTHGGRCCAYAPSLPSIETATIEDDYYILADYNRFKGGRKASVETHGGATLEEVVVPVIELELRDSNIEVKFLNDTITVSFRRKARIQLFSKTRLSDVSMMVNQKTYQGTQEDHNNWTFEMPDLTRPGQYFADIYSNNNLIASQLSFRIRKESASENDLI